MGVDRSPVGRESAALMASTALAAGTNLLFWVVAARLYAAADVGRASAAVSALTLLAMFGQLNLYAVVLRFLPAAGRHTRGLLGWGYAAVGAASLLLGTGYVLLGLGDDILRGRTVPELLFPPLVAVFALFVVQDGVLVALGRTAWVPVENLLAALAKLVLLVLWANSSGPGADVAAAAAWCVPLVVAVLVVGALAHGRLGPAAQRAGTGRLPGRRDLGSFVAAEYLHNLATTAVTFVPPLVVIAVLGAEQSAWFALPWLVVTTTGTLLWNVMAAYVTQSAREPGAVAAHARATARVLAAVVPAGTVGLLVAGPVALRLQGPAFAANGTDLLRVAALSLPATAVLVFAAATAMVERRLWPLVAVQAAGAAALLLALPCALRWGGLVAAGGAYVVQQYAVASVLLPGLRRRLRHGIAVPA